MKICQEKRINGNKGCIKFIPEMYAQWNMSRS